MTIKKTGMTDMTTGSPVKLILLFSVPLLIGNVFQQLYNMVDSMVVGRFVGEAALAAVGTGFPIIFMMTSMFLGLGIGASVMISQFYGAKDLSQVSATVNTIYTSIIISAIPLSLLSILLTDPILRLIQVPENTFPDARLYMIIVFAGLIGNLGFNINAGILQGLGDSKTPLLFLSVACLINIVLDLVFVLVFDWGVAGVAWATIIAQAFSWVFGIVYINKKYEFLHISPFRFAFDKQLFRQTMRLGVPTGIQQALFAVGMIAIQSLVNSYGSAFMAGYNGANKLDTFAFMPIQSFSTAVTTYVGQNIGAGKLQRVRHGTFWALILSFGVSIVLGGATILFAPALMQMFSPSPEVIAAGVAYLQRILPFYCLFSLFFILNAVMRGAGEAIVPMLTSIISLWLARVPAAYLFADWFGRDNMFFCYAAGWVLGDIITLYFYLRGNWKQKALTYSQDTSE